MSHRKNRTVSLIVSFIGIDYNLLKKSGGDNVVKFYLSGLFVLLIFAISFFSVFYAFDLMFHKWYAEFLLATFFSFTFLNIYLLLIQTFSKETLPAGYKVTFFSTSNITRTCFVLMISFLIAQPIKIFLLSDRLDRDIIIYKNNLYQQFLRNSDQLYHKDLDALNRQEIWYAQFDPSGEEIEKIRGKIADIHASIASDQQAAWTKISGSDFFLKRVTIAGKYWQSRAACLVVILIFSIPVYLIYSISDHSRYYTEKRNYDHDLVLDKYQEFKDQYATIFRQRYNKEIRFEELYEDPPFNKIRKPEPTYLKTSDLSEKIISNGL